KSSTAGFLSGLMKSIPPMQEMFDMAGMDLPSYLGTKQGDSPVDVDEPEVRTTSIDEA
ncbi:MAG: flotillin, partial [Firmicutes bacterium HGW-Firmicutes-15]